MGRAPCCEKVGLKKGKWTAEEDQTLIDYIHANGEGSWRSLPKNAGLLRCGKSCRLRWINYLRADLKRGDITPQEEDIIIRLHASMGNRWSMIATQLPGRTDNEIKNYWNSHLSRKIDAFRRPANMMSIPFSATYSSTTTAPDETKTATTNSKQEPPSNKRKGRGGRTSRKAMKKNKITYKSSATTTTTSSSPPIPSLSVSTGPVGATGPSALGINEGGEEEVAFEDLMMVDEMIVDSTGVLALIGERQISHDGDDVTGATITEGDVDGELLRGPNNVTANCDISPVSRTTDGNENRVDRISNGVNLMSSSGSNSNSKSSFDGEDWYNSCSNYYHAGESTTKFNDLDGVKSTVDDQMGWDWEISDIFKHESLLNIDENKDDGNYMLSWLWDQNAADDDLHHANSSNESRSSEELADKNDAILAWLLS